MLSGILSTHARSIEWGTEVNDILLDSNGSAFTGSYIFEIGSFGSTFIPTEVNMDEWAANWKVFDRGIDGNGWNPTDQFASGIANLQSDGTSDFYTPSTLSPIFTSGEQGYMWVFKTNTTYESGLEWALITNSSADGLGSDNWTFPSHSDQTGLPLEWYCSNASAVIFGGLDGVQGPGDHAASPGAFCIQTHTIVSVPEPTSSMLLAAACGQLLLTRRRRQTR
ncbi:MAG: PEP-CTERM sorting domain-containing protein [Verrucomicrobiaceae bacterium]|nr:PEP-CTERM sorting domain-containing protein [Verrucomicrobiaceae bacterium]